MDYSELEVAVGNPMGMLECQQYILEWEDVGCGGRVRRCDVDCCAYMHPYMKPTRIWSTGRNWEPLQCGNCCKAGKWNGKVGGARRWVHQHKLGQKSQQMVAGKGRVALAASIPRRLLRAVAGIC